MQWRIFFIGPMSGGGDHFDQMMAAVRAELSEHGYRPSGTGDPDDAGDVDEVPGGENGSSLVLTRSDGDEITLIRPHELFRPGSIRANVFEAIDDSDLVVADLSGVRPTVVYELAFAHALGVWTMMLGSDDDANAMFYLRDYRHARVDFGLPDIRSAEFRQNFQTWLTGRNKRFDSNNPFTDFYQAPIPDISAANGLANGYYENFLRPVLMPGSRIVDRTHADAEPVEVDGVLVVRPAHLRRLWDLVSSTGELLDAAFPGSFRLGEKEKVYVETPRGHRTCEFIVGGWLVDVPRTLLTLERSPRLRRTSSAGRLGVANQEAHDHLSVVLIERFLEVARHAVAGDEDLRRVEDRFFYGSPEEIAAFLAAAAGERPSVW
jgi:hypothetical protein